MVLAAKILSGFFLFTDVPALLVAHFLPGVVEQWGTNEVCSVLHHGPLSWYKFRNICFFMDQRLFGENCKLKSYNKIFDEIDAVFQR